MNSKFKKIKVLESSNTKKELDIKLYGEEQAKAVLKFHKQIEEYKKTPLVCLPNLASKLNVGSIYVKDESKRFSLNAFKGLGGSYAMFRILCDELNLNPDTTSLNDLLSEKYRKRLEQIEFVTCTDGNHGRGVSWASGLFGCKAHVYMPYGTAEVRAEAIRKVGPAKVEITDLSYDDTVKYALEMSKKYGWILIQDTSWDGYEKIPTWIIQGYLTMAYEITEELENLNVIPTHIFLQAGVGSMAGGMIAYFVEHYKNNKPIFTIVESNVADCIYRSAEIGDGKSYSVGGAPTTIMAGLNCGSVCSLIWPIIWNYTDFYISGSDDMAVDGMRAYAFNKGEDLKIISGESGASTMGALLGVLTESSMEEMKKKMKIDENSVILLINTEGDTDPENYRKIINGDWKK